MKTIMLLFFISPMALASEFAVHTLPVSGFTGLPTSSAVQTTESPKLIDDGTMYNDIGAGRTAQDPSYGAPEITGLPMNPNLLRVQ